MFEELFPHFPSYNFETYKTEMDNISITFAPMAVAQPDNPHNPFEHCHGEYELLFVMEGTSTYIIGQEQLHFSGPVAILIPPGVNHATNILLEENVTLSIGFSMYGQGESETKRFIYEATRGGTRGIYCEMSEEIFQLLLATYREHNRHGVFCREKVGAYFKIILTGLMEIFSRDVPEFTFQEPEEHDWNSDISRHILTKQVLDYINMNCGYQFTVNDLANEIHMSVGNLQRILNSTLGKTFTELLREARIYRAKGLIQRTDNKLRTIAELCGYSSYEHFYKQFRQVVGMSPQEYKELEDTGEEAKMYGTSEN
ncbi:MAG: AraC family transcriptional regulator [Lachnospiraceae bacterium]|nr:AraC family transcriptional regulator [Lachnospiraceae bacterium]